jgi:hypothetical protein
LAKDGLDYFTAIKSQKPLDRTPALPLRAGFHEQKYTHEHCYLPEVAKCPIYILGQWPERISTTTTLVET